jgi:hypothetical protein
VSTRVARWYIFKQKSKLGLFLEGLGMEDVGIVYEHLVYFTAILVYLMDIWYTL